MSYQKMVTIAYLDDGQEKEAVYTGGQMTLLKAMRRFSGEFPRLEPKNIRGVFHGPKKQPYPKFSVKKTAAVVLTLPECEINFFVEDESPGELRFLCPRCGERLDLWDYLRVAGLNPFWEIRGELWVVCRQCGTDLGQAVKTALNGMVELYGWLAGDRRRGEEAVKAAFAGFQTSLLAILKELAVESPRYADVLRRYFGSGFSHRQTFEEIAGHLGGITRERVRQLQGAGLRKLRKPGRTLRGVQGSLVHRLTYLQGRVEDLEQTREVLGALVDELKQRLREADLDSDRE